MVHDGEVLNYAIGGAIGAVFYIEPFATQDVDVFVMDGERLKWVSHENTGLGLFERAGVYRSSW